MRKTRLFELEAEHSVSATGETAGDVRRKPGDRGHPTLYDHPVKIDDAQEQAYVITFPGDNDMTIDEGSLADLELEAVPDRTVDLPFTVTLSSLNDVADYWLGENPTTAGRPEGDQSELHSGYRLRRRMEIPTVLMEAAYRSSLSTPRRTTPTGWTTPSR